KIVGNEDNSGTTCDHGVHAFDTPQLEQVVSDAEHLVNKEHVRVDVRCDREAQAGVHARRIPLHRGVDKFLQPGKGNYGIESAADLSPRHAHDCAVEIDVLSTGKVTMKASTNLNQ